MPAEPLPWGPGVLVMDPGGWLVVTGDPVINALPAGSAAGLPPGPSLSLRGVLAEGAHAAVNLIGFGGSNPRGFHPSAGAVDFSLDWLRRHQDTDGAWHPTRFMDLCAGSGCAGPGDPWLDPGTTAVAVLSYLGLGETHKHGAHSDVVKSGLEYLRDVQDEDGFFGDRSSPWALLNHALATLTMCEAWALTASPPLPRPGRGGAAGPRPAPASGRVVRRGRLARGQSRADGLGDDGRQGGERDRTVGGRRAEVDGWGRPLAGRRRGDAAAELFLSTGPLGELDASVKGLIRRPTGCFEQTSATLYPALLALRYLERTGGTDPEFTSRSRRYLLEGYQRILSYEADEGGFSLWGTGKPSRVLTALGIHLLKDLSEVMAVDGGVVSRAARVLARRRPAAAAAAAGFDRAEVRSGSVALYLGSLRPSRECAVDIPFEVMFRGEFAACPPLPVPTTSRTGRPMAEVLLCV